jgi:Protein of unknown function (DUF2950)
MVTATRRALSAQRHDLSHSLSNGLAHSRSDLAGVAGGFAVIAYPAKYGVSGVKTFMVSHDGMVYAADSGPQTARLAGKLQKFDPGSGWSKEEQTK